MTVFLRKLIPTITKTGSREKLAWQFRTSFHSALAFLIWHQVCLAILYQLNFQSQMDPYLDQYRHYHTLQHGNSESISALQMVASYYTICCKHHLGAQRRYYNMFEARKSGYS